LELTLALSTGMAVFGHRHEVRSVCWSGPCIIVGFNGNMIGESFESSNVGSFSLPTVSSKKLPKRGLKSPPETNAQSAAQNVHASEHQIISTSGNRTQVSNNEIIQLTTAKSGLVTTGHYDGIISSIAPSPVSSSAAASVGSDGWLRLWDSRSRRPSNSVNLRKGCARCVCWSPDGRMLGVGFDSGAVIVVDSLDFKEVWFVHHRTDGVLCVAFSVDGSKLATGSAASVIDLFDARSWKRLGQCEGHTGAVTHLDWSRDGRWLMSNSSELELMYWDVEGCARVPASGDARAAEWATQTCVLSWGVQGLYNAEVVAGSVLCADVFGAGEDAVIVSGDMKGVLRLSRWPCGKDSEQREFRCHGGGEVRCARFSCDGSTLWSVGGPDLVVACWLVSSRHDSVSPTYS